jgi:hypothetical protein
MKRKMTKTVAICLLMVFLCPLAHGKDLELKQKVGDFEVIMTINRNPPMVGSNHAKVVITDTASNSPVSDAQVTINYYMPPMPRMAPMNYTTSAELHGRLYQATMDLIMAGPWVIRVVMMRDGKRVLAKFNIDAQ